MKKQVIKILLALFITIFTFCGSYAQSVSVWDGTSEMWTQGQGTESSPYLIENAQQLAFIAEMVNGGVTHYDNTYFKLTTNVYIDSTTSWQPIGLNETYYFGGNFDGDNHTVTLYQMLTSTRFEGIFGCIQNTKIENLNVTGVIGRTYYGVIIGRSLNSNVIRNCNNYTHMISPTSWPETSYGGIVGICTINGHDESLTIENCHNFGEIASSSSSTIIGGIIGKIFFYGIDGNDVKNNNAFIHNCVNHGILSSNTSCGGIVGSIDFESVGYKRSGGTTVVSKTRYNNVRMKDCANMQHVSGVCRNNSTQGTGGIIGALNLKGNTNGESTSGGIVLVENVVSNNTILIEKCSNSTEISSSSLGSYIGNGAGIISTISILGSFCTVNQQQLNSYVTNTRINIRNCYNTGNISSDMSGGIIAKFGTNQPSNPYYLTLQNCYNTGMVNTCNIAPNSASITNCYYLNTCGGTGEGTAKTEAQMKSPSFPVILNTDSVVFVMDITPNINQGYPVFGSVSTLDASNLTPTTATLNGSYQMLYDVDTHGFEYKTNSESNYTTVNTTGDSPVSYNLYGLPSGTQYTYRFFVQKDGIIYRGSDKTFSTIQCALSAQIETSENTLCAGDTLTYTVVANSSNTAPYQYVWNTGENTNAISVADDANYTVTVTDIYGCTATASKQMTLYPAVDASITGSTVLCNGGNTTLTANGGTYYSWNTGSSQRSISVNQPGTYIATVTSIYGCIASDTVVVSMFDNPIITGDFTFCTGEYTTLTASGGDSYEWSTGATTSSINVNTEGSYTVTANTSSGCSGSTTVNVIQLQTNDVTITGNTLICSGIGTVLTASPGSSYLWSTGETTPSISVNNPGTYSVTVTNSNGCSSSSSQTVSLMEPTTISGDSHICSGESATLTAIGTGSYQWSNGANTPSITVNTPGTYSVTVSLPNGCSSSATIEVTAASLPTPSISGNNVICEGQSTTLTATGGNSYSWNTGSTNSSISINQSGVYTVTATNTEGCSASTSTTVTVNPLPNVSISGNNSFCQSGSTTLTASGANTYLWSNDSTLESISVSDAGNYTVTGTDANGCTNTASQTVSVNPTYNIPLTHSICEGESYNFYGQNLTSAGTYTHTLQTISGCDSMLTLTLTVKTLPTISISGNTTICEGQSTTLTATGGNSYSWSTGSTNSSLSINQSGIYTVTATNAEGCSASTSTTVTVNPLPTITIGGNTTICQGSSTTLTASGADSYSWSTGENTASVNISSFGVYTVTGTSVEGCSNTANVTVLVSQLPVITITGETDFCAGESTTLTANGGTSYLWSDGTTNASLTVNTAGTYQVIGYNTAGCNSMESVTVNQWQPASSEFTITTDEDCYEWNGQSYCQTGDYTQTFQTIHGCDSVVILHLTIETGIDNYAMNASMNIYPNPTSDVVNVQLTTNNEQFGNVAIQVYDVFGKMLDIVNIGNSDAMNRVPTGRSMDSYNVANTHGLSAQTTQIDLSRYANGVYFIKAVSEGNVLSVRKVVKN